MLPTFWPHFQKQKLKGTSEDFNKLKWGREHAGSSWKLEGISKLINDIEPYVAGEQPKPGQKVIKLNTNENPYPPSPKVKEALEKFDLADLRLYPDTNSTDVMKAAAMFDGVSGKNILRFTPCLFLFFWSPFQSSLTSYQ